MVRKRSGLSLKVRIFTITAAWTQWSGMQNSVLVPLLGAVLFLAMYDMWVVLLNVAVYQQLAYSGMMMEMMMMMMMMMKTTVRSVPNGSDN